MAYLNYFYMSEIFQNKDLGNYSKPSHEISGHQDKNPKTFQREKKIC